MVTSKHFRVALGLGALLLLFLGLLLPTGWYDQLPRSNEVLAEPPIRGVTLLRLCFGLEGLLLLFAAWRGRLPFAPGEPIDLGLAAPAPPEEDLRHPGIWLAVAVVLGAALRFWNLGSDLWLDEITTVLGYQNVSAFHVLTAYTSSNNHLLNTLLIKAMAAVAGPVEWAVRLPAALLGIGCIPALYYLARLSLSRREAVCAALLLAVSYHHIFFSQNARGYTGLLLWGMLGTAFFLRAIATNAPRYWVLYIASMFLAVATVLYGVFILAGHGLVLLALCVTLWRQRRPVLPLAWKAFCMWALLGLLCVHLYASIIPQVYVYSRGVYRSPSVGYSPLSREHLEEVIRGVAAGFGGAALAGLAALAALGLGMVLLIRKHPFFTFTLLAPLITTTGFLLAGNLRFSPRFFLWALPVSFLFIVGGTAEIGRMLAGRLQAVRLQPLALLGLLCPWFAVSALSLPGYYYTPKQPNRASLRWLMAQKEREDLVVAVHLAEWGPRYYLSEVQTAGPEEVLMVRSAECLRKIEEDHPGRDIWLLTTFPRALLLEFPELGAYIADHYVPQRTFPASIGDGEITIWK